MQSSATTAIGLGVYTIPEAAQLVGLHANAVRRIVCGSRRRAMHGAGHHVTRPAFAAEYGEDLDDGRRHVEELSFRDLVELRQHAAFRSHGVSARELRLVSQRLMNELESTHPLTPRRFRTDGRFLLEAIPDEAGSERFVDALRDQHFMSTVIAPFLQDVSWQGARPIRWTPSAGRRRVIVDPTRQFGRPIVRSRGVPTGVLFAAFEQWQDADEVSSAYDVPVEDVLAAVAFERSLRPDETAA